jgi:predicted porin
MLSYGVGGFKIQYAGASIKNADALTWNSSAIGATPAAAGATQTGEALDADAVDNGTTSSADALALTYDFGMAKVYVGTTSAKTGGDADQKGSSSTYGVSIPFGAASIAIASSAASYKSAAGATTKETGLRIMAKYALSKRTTAYLQNGTSKVTGTTRANTQTGLGLTHNF